MSARLSYACLFTARNAYNLSLQTRGFKRWLYPTLLTLKNKKDKLGPQPPIHRSALIEWNYSAELFAFGKRLGEDFDSELLQRALTTREYVIKESEAQKSVGIIQPELSIADNKEMVEPGEKIIKNYILRYLRTVFPKLPEEGIFSIQQYLTNDELLAMVASNIGLEDLILAPEQPPDRTTLVNVFKAVIVSLAESSGLDRANLFVRDFILTNLVGKNVNDIWQISDPIKLLSDILDRDGKPSFEARLIGEAGRSTILANFQVGFYVNKELVGVGFGESIAIAKEMAARDVLQHYFGTTDTMRPIPFDIQLKTDSSEPFANLSVQDWCEKNINKLVNYA